MEGIHGVDVSWLHHSPKDHHGHKDESLSRDQSDRNSASQAAQSRQSAAASLSKENGANVPQNSPHRPHILKRSSVDHGQSSGQTAVKSPKDQKQPQSSRRNSWMSSISSKFSSNSTIVGSGSEPASPSTGPKSPPLEHSNPFGASHSPGVSIAKTGDSPAPTPPVSPKPGHGFLSGALRRLSSGGGTSMGKAAGTGGVCPRKTMNLDQHRDRCAIPDLKQAKLRRVAFCVDVEIAGAAQYVDEELEDSTNAPIPLEATPTLTKLQLQAEQKQKKKDQLLKKGEGEALKRPTTVVEEKEKNGVIKATGEKVGTEVHQETRTSSQSEPKEPSKKKEKKKRSESERKERKERKQQQAIANGKIPAEIKRESSSESATESTPGTGTPPSSHDRPTTDPLRIYRRCCQLRESPVLKRIAEQIALPSACPVATPGVLSCLDLSGYWMQMHEIVTLGDYLAVVPVKKLIMEDCGLTDEAMRVILAGLLAAKTPEQARYNRKLGKNGHVQLNEKREQVGVIEKLSMKNNPKIGQEGWRHISLFIYLSRSLKAIDLSMIPFPQSKVIANSLPPPPSHHTTHDQHQADPTPTQMNMASIIQAALGTRLAGSQLEELVMADCNVDTDGIAKIVEGVIKCGASRLGLASNNITKDGFEHILRYVNSSICQGLDIGGNYIRDFLDLLAETLKPTNRLFALSLADCRLLPQSLEKLLPALVRLENFRFIDLSHNRDLFASKPSALKLIRTYIPQFPIIKRIHLLDVAMTPEHAIALAEVLPESRTLAHLNILENHLLAPLSSAKTEAGQEEACAFYASLMAAVRVSETLICIDVDVPSPDSSEVVKALAKQVVAYSLRNLERLPLAETAETAKSAMADPHGGEHKLSVPDVLLHLVGHVDGFPEDHDQDEPAPDGDYIVGGTGVVKALDCLLNRANDGRKGSRDASPMRSGTGTPNMLHGTEVSKGKAKDMSKNLLESARKIRARLQPALVKEAKSGDAMSYKRLQFLDNTLERIIQRFEDEYPECRLRPAQNSNFASLADPVNNETSLENSSLLRPTDPDNAPTSPGEGEDEDENSDLIRPASTPRRASSPSLASRQAQEEGRMHRFGQRIKRDILRPETEDYAHGTTGTEIEAKHMKDLRRMLESFEGNEIKERVDRLGPDAVLEAISATADELAEWERTDPWKFDEVKEVRGKALALYNDEMSKGSANVGKGSLASS